MKGSLDATVHRIRVKAASLSFTDLCCGNMVIMFGSLWSSQDWSDPGWPKGEAPPHVFWHRFPHPAPALAKCDALFLSWHIYTVKVATEQWWNTSEWILRFIPHDLNTHPLHILGSSSFQNRVGGRAIHVLLQHMSTFGKTIVASIFLKGYLNT